MARVRISNPTAAGHNTVTEVDGHDVSAAVRRVTVVMAANDINTVELDLVVFDGVEIDGKAKVALPAATRAALVALGWTPPERRVVGDVASLNRQIAFG